MGAKAHGSARMQEILKEVSPLLNVCSIDGADISNALSEQWEDFEDCLIWRAAKKIKADALALQKGQLKLSNVWDVTNTDYYRPSYHHTRRPLGRGSLSHHQKASKLDSSHIYVYYFFIWLYIRLFYFVYYD